MGWADNYIKQLQAGNTVRFEPISSFYALSRGDIVLCQVKGHQYVHLVKQLDPVKKLVLIGNNRGRENGWTSYDRVYGRVTKVEP
jgi:hypothetical protein